MKKNVYWLYIAFVLAAVSFLAFMSYRPGESAHKAPAVSSPIRSDVTTLVQTRLKTFGYTIVVDGLYGPQTRRVVASWQQSNGLTVDGIAGTETLASLGPLAPAVRLTPNPSAGSGSGTIEQLIRDIWPDDSEEWALRIAKRESRYVPTAHNACCHGLFQIHFRAHQSWLDDYGVYQPSDLYDPVKNIIVALALYQQTGPGPWAL